MTADPAGPDPAGPDPAGPDPAGPDTAGRTVVVDARGLLCPQPVIDAARAARGLAAGTLMEVWATDPAAALDLPAWCRLRGHELVEVADGPPPERSVRVVVRLR